MSKEGRVLAGRSLCADTIKRLAYHRFAVLRRPLAAQNQTDIAPAAPERIGYVLGRYPIQMHRSDYITGPFRDGYCLIHSFPSNLKYFVKNSCKS